MNRERLLAAIGRNGLDVPDAAVDAWLTALGRIDAGLGPAPGIAAAPGAGTAPDGVGPAPDVDDGPWVWRPDAPLAPTGSGPLDGWRLAVKDLIAVAGRPIRAGSRARAGAAPEPADAPPVARLRAAGASLVGTTKLHEFAFGVSGLNDVDGTPRNPAAPGRVPGGSSSGSAVVVATGEATVALGTDTGGSARVPGAFCGVVGMKPSFGAVPTEGTLPLAPSLDHIGWFAASVAAARRAAAALGVAVGPSGEALGPVWGVHRGGLEGADETVTAAFAEFEEAARRAGVTLLDVSWPGGEEVFAVSTAVMFAEAAHVHRDALAAAGRLYGADVAARLTQGGAIDLTTYLRARTGQQALRARCLAVLAEAGVAAVLSPTVLAVPPLLADAADPAVAGRLVANTRLADVTGLPALSIPVPGTALPVGLQVESADDATALAVGERIERLLAERAG